MITYENQCAGCDIPCIGAACSYRNVPCFYCDECGYEATLYHFDGEQLCLDCIKDRLDKVTENDANY